MPGRPGAHLSLLQEPPNTFHQDGDEKVPPRRVLQHSHCKLHLVYTKGGGTLHWSLPHAFQSDSHIPFKIQHSSWPQKTVLCQLRNIKPLAIVFYIRILYCLMQALKNMEGVIRYLSHTSQLHTYTCAAITTLSSQEGPWQTFTAPVKAFKTIFHT